MTGDATREGQVLDFRTGDYRQHVIDTRAAEQNVNADLGRGLCGNNLTLPVERNDFEIGGRAARLDGLI